MSKNSLGNLRVKRDVMKVLAVLGGRSPKIECLQAWAKQADIIYAADSGADVCLSAGLKPIVTGDMDSFTKVLDGLRVVENPDQETTDCDKLLQLIESEVSKPVVVIAGFEGDRIDHMLANLTSFAKSSLPIQILLETGMAFVLRSNETYNHSQTEGKTFSVIPISNCEVSLRNCQWPLDNQKLSLESKVSVSNQANEDFSATVHSGIALLVFTGQFSPW